MSTENELRDAFQFLVDGGVPRPDPYQRLVNLRQRRDRMRRAVVGSVVVAATVATVGVGALVNRAGGGAVPTGGVTGTPAAPRPFNDSGVNNVVAAPANHLYATVRHCPNPTSSWLPRSKPGTSVYGLVGCVTQLLGSDDGGYTWTVRVANTDVLLGSAVTATTLLGYRQALPPSPSPGKGFKLSDFKRIAVLSTDGGRHWRPVAFDSAPVASVQAGGFAASLTPQGGPYKVYVVDVHTGRAAPLAAQPAFSGGSGLQPDMVPTDMVPTPGPTLWAAFAGSVAVSRDAGRTWRTTTVDRGCAGALWQSGPTAKLACQPSSTQPSSTQPSSTPSLVVRLYQSDDFGLTWRLVTLPRPLPFVTNGDEFVGAYFTADGRLIGGLSLRIGGLRLWLLAGGGRAWQEIPMLGVPQPAQVLTMMSNNGLLLSAADGDVSVYLCTDLTHWTRVAVMAP